MVVGILGFEELVSVFILRKSVGVCFRNVEFDSFIFCLTLNKKPSGENLIKCKGSVNTLFKCCAITGNRSTTIESQCLQNGSWTPVELNCVPNEGNLLKGIFNKTVMGYGFSRLHPLLTYFLLLVTHRAKCSKMVQNCIF